MHLDLNFCDVLAMLLDFKRTGDWFYSCRNVPPLFLRRRWSASGDAKMLEVLFRVHESLSPVTNPELKGMSPSMYRQEYARMMEGSTGRKRRRKEERSKKSFQMLSDQFT